MRNVSVASAKEDELPFKKTSIYHFHSKGRYPEIIFKVGGKLFFDLEAWEKEVNRAKQEHIQSVMKMRRGLL